MRTESHNHHQTGKNQHTRSSKPHTRVANPPITTPETRKGNEGWGNAGLLNRRNANLRQSGAKGGESDRAILLSKVYACTRSGARAAPTLQLVRSAVCGVVLFLPGCLLFLLLRSLFLSNPPAPYPISPHSDRADGDFRNLRHIRNPAPASPKPITGRRRQLVRGVRTSATACARVLPSYS